MPEPKPKRGRPRLEIDPKQVKAAREAVMVKLIRNTLAETNFNVSDTSRRLNISRENLYYFMKRFNIVRPDE